MYRVRMGASPGKKVTMGVILSKPVGSLTPDCTVTALR
jgi:hypothetical protein